MTKKNRDLETPAFLHDWPLRDKDTAHFYFDEYARTLARLVASKETRTPLTIGISGAWGTGKTTLMQRVRKMLDETRCLEDPSKPALLSYCNDDEKPASFRVCKTVWFDAWKYSGEEHVLAALLRAIVLQMQGEGFWEKVKAALSGPQKEETRWLGVLLNALTGFAGITGAATGYNLNLQEYQVDTPYKTAAAFFDYFDDSFTRLVASWVHGKLVGKEEIEKAEEKGVLVVFIDDLDRCLPKRAVEVLEAVKLFLDKAGCAFVIGADIKMIQQAVAAHYREAGVSEQVADDYLEKVIQLRFEIPPTAVQTMKKYLEAEKSADEVLLGQWKVLAAGAEINPRRVKALLNELNLQWAVLRNTGQAQAVNRDDFIRWQVLARSAPRDFLQRLRDMSDLREMGDANSAALQMKFVSEALRWAREGGTEEDGAYRQYAPYRRFRMVLRAIDAFGPGFDAEALNAFLHLAAPAASVEAASVAAAAAETPQSELRPGRAAESGERFLKIGEIEFAPIPTGAFIMGSREDDLNVSDVEKPQHTLDLGYAYYMGRTPVTNCQFSAYASRAGIAHPAGETWEEKAGHPVVNVDWKTALGFCNWLNETFAAQLPPGMQMTLPSEAEWEKAARGEFGNTYPWGNEFDYKRCNTTESGIGATTPVGTYSPQGDSPYGCADMAGNVWEWTRSSYKPYPYDSRDGREKFKSAKNRILRGGSWNSYQWYARCANRDYNNPVYWFSHFGFRVALSPKT